MKAKIQIQLNGSNIYVILSGSYEAVAQEFAGMINYGAYTPKKNVFGDFVECTSPLDGMKILEDDGDFVRGYVVVNAKRYENHLALRAFYRIATDIEAYTGETQDHREWSNALRVAAATFKGIERNPTGMRFKAAKSSEQVMGYEIGVQDSKPMHSPHED